MDLGSLRQKLYKPGTLISPFSRRSAIKELFGLPGPEGVTMLAEALARQHPDHETIVRTLGALSLDSDGDRIEALWAFLGQHPQPALAALLTGLGWPPNRRADAKTVRAVLGAATSDANAQVMAAVVFFAQKIPDTGETLTDAIVEAWLRSRSANLGNLLLGQRRRPGLSSLAALADALCADHPEQTRIAAFLNQLSPASDGEKIESLWARLGTNPKANFAAVLANLGWPSTRQPDAQMVRGVLSVATPKAHANVLTAVNVFAGALSPDGDGDQIEALWAFLGQQPQPALADVLTRLGWPPNRRADVRTIRAVFGAATPGASAQVMAAVVFFAQKIPDTGEALTDAIVEAWLRSRSANLGNLVLGQHRQPSMASLAALADALCADHSEQTRIAASLNQLSPASDGEKIESLWARLATNPKASFAAALSNLGWPTTRRPDARLVRGVLSVAVLNAHPNVLDAVAVFAGALETTNEALNDDIYTAWLRSQSPKLEELITTQRRQPGTLQLDALHALVTGDLDRYGKLHDASGRLFVEAYDLAPESFRERMARTVQVSGDLQLVEARRQAIARSTIDPAQTVVKFIRFGEEDGLFEAVRSLRLGQTLDLCERWANGTARPTDPRRRAVVERVVTFWRELGNFQIEPAPALPDGLVDIFEYWRGQKPSDADLRNDLAAQDPFTRARGLYLGHERGIVDDGRIRQAATSEHWPERLVARLVSPAAFDTAADDHVMWVSACAGDAALLGAPIGGTPEDYARNSQLMQQARGPSAARTRSLLSILCAFQSEFIENIPEYEDLAAPEPTERNSASYEDAPEVEF